LPHFTICFMSFQSILQRIGDILKSFFKNKTVILVILAVILAITMSAISSARTGETTPVSDFVSVVLTPVRYAVSFVSEKLEGFTAYFTDFDAIKAENAELRKKLAE